ncbi:hypothetical protein V6N13_015945 [Hibiscus sabdariffa]
MMARVVLGVDEWLGVKRDDLRGLFKCSMEGCVCGSGSRGVSSMGGLLFNSRVRDELGDGKDNYGETRNCSWVKE